MSFFDDFSSSNNCNNQPIVKLSVLRSNNQVCRHGGKGAGLVSSCVARLGRFNTGLQHPYYHVALPGRKLRDISVLSNYVHLQKLELSNNRITDLSCVSHMPFLVILDVSHNEISDFFGFDPPKNLKEVNFSYNVLTQMKDMSAYEALVKLELDHNRLKRIHGLEKCCKLTYLSVAHNRITSICSLDDVPLKDLNLRGNRLTSTEGLENLKRIQTLDLSVNRISSLAGLNNLHLLGSMNLERNQISEIEECKHIQSLFLLRELNLLGNPVQEKPEYRLSVVFLIQHLTLLDQEKVTIEEKVLSINKYDPPLDVVAARDHMTQLMYQLMQPQHLYDTTLPSDDAPYPMLVLTGPQGCGKREMAHRLCEDFEDFFAYGVSHTTREPYFGEVNGSDYHFVSEEEFELLVHRGAFLQTVQYGGHKYGLSRDAIEDVAREGLACCVQMELEGVLSLKKSIFEPRYILLIPTIAENYKAMLRSRNLYTDAQIEAALSRIELYDNFNRERPGFFDNVIRCDYWDRAYRMLERVVKNYLLLEDQEEEASGEDKEEEPPTEQQRSDSSASPDPATSSLDPSEPLDINSCTRGQHQLAPSKTPAELASIRRREQPVREAVVGKSPGVYSWLIRSSDESPGHSADTIKGDEQPQQAPAGITPLSDRRPGSGVKPVLPPIPPERKTPQVGSPLPSPSRRRRRHVQASTQG
ncbi:leucine-rich repeat and guanylate kinase domain-containing protein isoform X2 [Hippocampus zosterae]|uniref:leucine-rich repeat and guanylate kinase domain-containing protein isoform X2 n=1 Tax=Hippocampus zosterae TaxID=109293 RepID=UPI00223CFCDE|nr:leucine-rich repeat and guanylate kinase domain-containing protein isoform X2 [Hippocampus zosterae]